MTVSSSSSSAQGLLRVSCLDPPPARFGVRMEVPGEPKMGEEKRLGEASITLIAGGAAIVGWGEALEEKDPGTWTHCNRIAAFATVLAQALRLDDEEVRAI